MSLIKEKEEKLKIRKREHKEIEKRKIKELKYSTIKNYFGDEQSILPMLPNKSVISLNQKIEEFLY